MEQEERSVRLNVLYSENAEEAYKQAQSHLKGDAEGCFLYLPRPLLQKLGLWDGHIRQRVVACNTSMFYTQDRRFLMGESLLEHAYLYSLLRGGRKARRVVDPLKHMDIMMDLKRHRPRYSEEKCREIVSLILNGRKVSFWFVRNVVELGSEELSLRVCRAYGDHDRIMNYLIRTNPGLAQRLVAHVDVSNLTKLRFLKTRPYNAWSKHGSILTQSFVSEYFSEFAFPDLFLITDIESIWINIRGKSYSERHALYGELSINEQAVMNVGKTLKTMVQSNLGDKAREILDVSAREPLSAISEIFCQACKFNSLIPLLGQIIPTLPKPVLDIFMFYVIRELRARGDYIKEDSYCRWYTNLVMLIKILVGVCDVLPFEDLIRAFLRGKKFSCLPLIEALDEIPRDILGMIENAHHDVFRYENIDLKLKTEISARFYSLSKAEVRCVLTWEALKSLIPYEVLELLKRGVSREAIYEVLESARNDRPEDFLVIRNMAILIDRHEVCDLPWIEEFFEGMKDDEREDVRLLANSILSKIATHKSRPRTTDGRRDVASSNEPGEIRGASREVPGCRAHRGGARTERPRRFAEPDCHKGYYQERSPHYYYPATGSPDDPKRRRYYRDHYRG
jgi:hypothetical protein